MLAREFGKKANDTVEDPGNGPSVGSRESDAERVERLLQERKEQQKAEREKQKAEQLAQREQAPAHERAVADAKDLEKSIPKAIDQLKVNSQKLKNNAAASSLVAAAIALSKNMAENLKQIQAILKNGKGNKSAISSANKLMAEKVNLDKPMRAMLK